MSLCAADDSDSGADSGADLESGMKSGVTNGSVPYSDGKRDEDAADGVGKARDVFSNRIRRLGILAVLLRRGREEAC